MSKVNFFNRSKTMDLSQGRIFSKLIVFALPLLAGQVLQTLYNSVDSIIIGNFEDANALAAVSASAMVSMIVSGFFTGMSGGASALFARLFGSKKYDTLHDAIHTGMLFSIIFGVLLSVLGIIFTPFLLNITSCPEDIFNMAVSYLRIYLIGVLFTSLYNIGSGILRSVGDSLSPFIALAFASCLNIVLDLLLVAVIPLGVSGVAIATTISQFLSTVFVFYKLLRMDEAYRLHFSQLRIDWKLLKEITRLGLPAGIQASVHSIGGLFVQRFINSFSPVAIAGISSAMKVDGFVGMPCNALGLAMTTFIGQNLGAGKNGRAHRSVGVAVICDMIYVVVLSIPIYIFAPQLVRIFSPDPEVISYGTGMLHVIMSVYPLMGILMIFGGILRGYGYSITAMCSQIFGAVFFRLLFLSVTMKIEHNINFIYYSFPVSWIVVIIPELLCFFLVIKKRYKA